jgi:hypothetical protein
MTMETSTLGLPRVILLHRLPNAQTSVTVRFFASCFTKRCNHALGTKSVFDVACAQERVVTLHSLQPSADQDSDAV